ncbi:MAG TPA: iron chelate uptake ABC transporter family permease subunit, partial [Spirochaetota bacterium]|nr:iron chelate uptake ABC transporter family permease subunit [Spirochaetota bacterium]
MKTPYKILIFLIVAMALLLVSLSLGTRTISPAEMAGIVLGGPGSADYTILVKLRLPRAVLAMVVGASLAV